MSWAAQPPPRRMRKPVSQQRYAVRRLMVVTALVLIGFGAYRGISTLTDGDEASGQEPPAPSSSAPAASGPTSVAPTQAPTTAATSPPTEPEQTGPPSADNPADVLIVGDSEAGTFAPFLEPVLGEMGINDLVDIELDYVVSSGLARPDFYNWPAHLAEKLAGSSPDIVIVMFGGNDAQGLATADGSFPIGMPTAENAAEWTTEYVRRVHEVLELIVAEDDVRVVWVGIPNAKDPAFTARLEVLDQAIRTALEEFPDVVFVDTWELFDSPNGGIAELVVDPRDGRAKPVRAADGFHLNNDGAEILAVEIAVQVETILQELGADV